MDASFGLRREPAIDPATVESDPVLVARLRDEIARDGPLTFARFMTVALYDADRGYYASTSARPTRGGDFLTAPELHPAFGRLVGRQLAEVWARLGRPGPFVLREHGAGAGTLGVAVIRGLERDEPDLAAALVYEPVEVHPHRLADLHERFAAAGLADHLAPATGPVIGAVVAIELLDALPVHRVRGRGERIEELFVDWHDDALGWTWGPPSTQALADRLSSEGVRLADGQVGEVCLVLDDWVAEVAASLARGILLVIDYGHDAQELYGPGRPEGTLRAYLGHHVHADALRHVGRQDLTAHVDLTALARAAETAGLDRLGETSQAEFVAGLGLADLLEEAGSVELVPGDPAVADYLALRAATARLLDPRALGAFRVLAFGREIGPEPALRGLAWRSPRRT